MREKKLTRFAPMRMVRLRYFFALSCFLCAVGAGVLRAQTVAEQAAARTMAIEAIKDYLQVADHLFSSELTVPTPDQPAGGSKGSPRMVAAGELMAKLVDSAVRVSPRDSDLVSLAVYNLLSVNWHREAERAAVNGCTDGGWWCSALMGLIRHHEGRFQEAEKEYDRALALMPSAQRCKWNDISLVMNHVNLTREYRRRACEQREAVDAMIWALADPLWMELGNERRTEHYSRWMSAELVNHEMRLFGWRTFGTDGMNRSLEPVLRFGLLEWENGVTIGCAARGRLDCRRYHAHYDRDRFIPTQEQLNNVYNSGVFEYTLAPYPAGGGALHNSDIAVPQWSHWNQVTGRKPFVDVNSDGALSARNFPGGFGEAYASRFGKVHTLRDGQVGVLIQGSKAVLLAAFNPRDAALANGRSASSDCLRDEYEGWCVSMRPWREQMPTAQLLSGIAVADPVNGTRSATTSVLKPGQIARHSIEVPGDSALVSLEARPTEDLEWPFSVRHRFAVFRPDSGAISRVSVSDLFLFPGDVGRKPASAEEILAVMLPRSRVDRNEAPGVYWEVYGLAVGDSVVYELAVGRADSSSGFLRSLAQRVGLAGRSGSAVVRWLQRPITAADLGREGQLAATVQVNLSTLRPGDYVIELTAQVAGEAATRARKTIRIR